MNNSDIMQKRKRKTDAELLASLEQRRADDLRKIQLLRRKRDDKARKLRTHRMCILAGMVEKYCCPEGVRLCDYSDDKFDSIIDAWQHRLQNQQSYISKIFEANDAEQDDYTV